MHFWLFGRLVIEDPARGTCLVQLQGSITLATEGSPLDGGHVHLLEQSDHAALLEGNGRFSCGWKQTDEAVEMMLLE